jgi:hypothetical protein
MESLSLCSDFSNVVSIEPLKPNSKYSLRSNVSVTSFEPITILHLNFTLEDRVGGDWVTLAKYP